MSKIIATLGLLAALFTLAFTSTAARADWRECTPDNPAQCRSVSYDSPSSPPVFYPVWENPFRALKQADARFDVAMIRLIEARDAYRENPSMETLVAKSAAMADYEATVRQSHAVADEIGDYLEKQKNLLYLLILAEPQID